MILIPLDDYNVLFTEVQEREMYSARNNRFIEFHQINLIYILFFFSVRLDTLESDGKRGI